MADASRPTFEALDEATERWKASCLQAMETYFRNAGDERADQPTPAMLDAAWVQLRAELKSSSADEAAIKNAINIVGFAFGEALVRDLQMEWAVATDSQGKDIVVHGTSGWVVHPRDVVRKRYANDESGFMSALYDTLAERSN